MSLLRSRKMILMMAVMACAFDATSGIARAHDHFKRAFGYFIWPGGNTGTVGGGTVIGGTVGGGTVIGGTVGDGTVSNGTIGGITSVTTGSLFQTSAPFLVSMPSFVSVPMTPTLAPAAFAPAAARSPSTFAPLERTTLINNLLMEARRWSGDRPRLRQWLQYTARVWAQSGWTQAGVDLDEAVERALDVQFGAPVTGSATGVSPFTFAPAASGQQAIQLRPPFTLNFGADGSIIIRTAAAGAEGANQAPGGDEAPPPPRRAPDSQRAPSDPGGDNPS